MEINIHQKIADIPAEQWNQLVRDNNPLVRHEFLQAMETHGCVGEKFGWLSCHVAVYENGQLLAAMPLYQKTNSYGEFVFDHSWADAYQRAGLAYFPKLVSAVPYTPATGQRLLCAAGHEAELWPLLINTAQQLMQQNNFSSLHCLFPESDEQDILEQQGGLARHDLQYHWFNRDYANFADFMETLTSRKRKNIRREREAVDRAGVTLRRLNGHQASDRDWDDFARFYDKTFEEKWGMATFNRGFFAEVASQLPDNVLLVLADLDDECIAGSLMYVSDTHLYGRHWGCTQQIDQLHFEACYYQGIEFAIEQGLAVFEPGAQGEHKIARGFVPTLTRSSHWLAEDVFAKPIAEFCRHEREAVAQYREQLSAKIPYKEAAE